MGVWEGGGEEGGRGVEGDCPSSFGGGLLFLWCGWWVVPLLEIHFLVNR